MTPTIRIDQDVWNELQKRAEPFVDNPNSVLRRLLRLDEPRVQRNGRHAVRAVGRRARSGEIMDRTAYREPILRALLDLGGEAAVETVLEKVYAEVRKHLTPLDHQVLPSGHQTRWRNRAQWARFRLVEAGLLDKDSARGRWRLTDAGRRAAAAAKQR